jgi:lysophospholipase L1-like esterase
MKNNLSKPSLAASVALSSAFALILCEAALRLSGFEFALYPTKLQFGWPDPVTLQNRYRVDSQLLWVTKDYSSKVEQWKDKRPVAVFMGDSCTEFGRYDEALKAIIYRQNQNSAFTFVNMGVGGWSSYQGLQQLKRDVLPMKPRFITIYYGWNDHWGSFGIEDKEIGQFNLEHSTLLLETFSRLRLVQLINKAVFAMKQGSGAEVKRRPERVSLPDFRSNLLGMVHLARDSGIVPILITAPSSHRKGAEPAYLKRRWLNDLNELVPLHGRYVQVLRDIGSDENVPLIDLFAEFAKMPKAELDRLFLEDGIHLTNEGNEKIAEFIYACLARNDLSN